jgi:nucleoside-diphosphate-sugar epimerase
MRIIITGSSGLLGRAVVSDFRAAGHDLLTVDRVVANSRDVPPPDIAADLTAPDVLLPLLQDADAIVHLAAHPSLESASEPKVWRDNIDTVSNALFAACASGVRKVVYASSQSVLGLPTAPAVITPDYLPVDEAHPCRPTDGYSLSKLTGEELAGMMCRRGDLDVRCLRFPVIWDCERHGEFVRRRLSDPEQGAKSLWAYIDARDAARATRLSIEGSWTGLDILNVTSRHIFSESTLSNLIQQWFSIAPRSAAGLEAIGTAFDWRKADLSLGFRSRYMWSRDDIADTF